MNCGENAEIRHLSQADVRRHLPDRDPEAHKGDFGKLLLLCGSRGYTGAAYLASMGALRCGAGLVFLGVPESIYAIEAVKLVEPVVFSLPDREGTVSELAIPEIRTRLPQMDAVLIGCGIGRSAGAGAVVRAVLEEARCPVILDADGISLMAEHKDILRERSFPTILTPHEGEFLRFGGSLEEGRVAAALNFSAQWNCILVLKGHNTCISDGTICYVNDTGNPGMAVGGSGDLLAGMIAGLIGQGLSPFDAVACSVWLHGAAGDLCAGALGQYAMLPSDMLEVLPRLLK